MEKRKEKSQKIVISEAPAMTPYQEQQVSVNNMIMQAIEKGVPVETMERVLNMRAQLKAEYAKEKFDEAMSKFQAECPVIKKTKSVPTKSGRIAYSYAPLEQIIGQVKSLLAENGLSYMIKTEVKESGVKSTCIVKHSAGHSETSEMEVPLGNKTDVMSNSQVTAAASTFSKRYAFVNAFGIMTGDDDNESILQEDEKYDDKVESAKAKLNQCMNEEQLRKVWSEFPKAIKSNREIIVYANEIKENINENASM